MSCRNNINTSEKRILAPTKRGLINKLPRKIALLSFVLLIIVFQAACTQPSMLSNPSPAITAENTMALNGKLTFAGSTSLQPLVEKIGVSFHQVHPEVTLDISAGGSEIGIEAVREGTVDIGMVSRELTPAESEEVTKNQIAVDVIALAVHPSNPLKSLTLEDLHKIYTGQITNWRELGGNDQPIMVIARETSSGTRVAFDNFVLKGKTPQAPHLKTVITAGDATAAIKKDPNAIGYIGFGNIDPGVKILAINQFLPDQENARNGKYPLIRPLILITGPLSQPLSQDFIAFALSSQGQQIVSSGGWLPVK